jgi:hypothetical protein
MRKRPMPFDINLDIDKAQQGRETLSLTNARHPPLFLTDFAGYA